ncbi:unnamed protein product [[Candida] boidinii]|nr:unnamed protein product [[Candida] boidinii]
MKIFGIIVNKIIIAKEGSNLLIFKIDKKPRVFDGDAIPDISNPKPNKKPALTPDTNFPIFNNKSEVLLDIFDSFLLIYDFK